MPFLAHRYFQTRSGDEKIGAIRIITHRFSMIKGIEYFETRSITDQRRIERRCVFYCIYGVPGSPHFTPPLSLGIPRLSAVSNKTLCARFRVILLSLSLIFMPLLSQREIKRDEAKRIWHTLIMSVWITGSLLLLRPVVVILACRSPFKM